MDGVDAQAVVAEIPLFAETLDADQLRALAHKSAPVLFPTGSILMTEGDFATSMFAIVEGRLAVTVSDADGGTRHVADLGAGDIVGEMSLMTGARRSATVIAKTEVVALEVTKFSLEAIIARAPELVDRFGEILARRQAELDEIAAAAPVAKDDIVSQIRRFFGRLV
jgi:CRP-like cAMP-binding protein